MYGTQWEPHMGISNLANVVGSEQLIFEPFKAPCNIVTEIQAQPGFCASAAESLVSFQGQQHDQHQIEVPAWSFDFPKTTDSPVMFCQASGDNFTNNGTRQARPTSQFTSSFHSVAESFLSSSADSHSSSERYSEFLPYSEKHSNFQPGNMPSYDQFDDAAIDEKPLEICFQRDQLDSCRMPERQRPRHGGAACVNATRRAPCGKRRIRWTKDLNEPFMMIVNSLGGPHKAKPKAILEMMKSDSLSISHVKSHLQKYRSTIYQHKALQEKSEEGQKTDGVTELQVKIHMQIEESRQLQLEVRRSIHQQLEMQRNLQVLIEQQRKQLKIMLDQQKEGAKLEKYP